MCLCGQLLKMQANSHKRTNPKVLQVKVMQVLHTHIHTTISIYMKVRVCVCACGYTHSPTHTHTCCADV